MSWKETVEQCQSADDLYALGQEMAERLEEVEHVLDMIQNMPSRPDTFEALISCRDLAHDALCHRRK